MTSAVGARNDLEIRAEAARSDLEIRAEAAHRLAAAAKAAQDQEQRRREREWGLRQQALERQHARGRRDAWAASPIPRRPDGKPPNGFGEAGWFWSGYVVQCSGCGRWRAWLPHRLAPAFCPACENKPSRRRTTGDPFDHLPTLSGLHKRKR